MYFAIAIALIIIAWFAIEKLNAISLVIIISGSVFLLTGNVFYGIGIAFLWYALLRSIGLLIVSYGNTMLQVKFAQPVASTEPQQNAPKQTGQYL